MNNKQKIFYVLMFAIWLLLMFYCYFIHDYKTIIKSICIFIGSFILVIIYSELGDNNGKDN